MNIGPLEVTFHRTVRVAEGSSPSSLPRSLGSMQLHAVKDYRANCPAAWDDGAYFAALHETEACWLDFRAPAGPVAVLVGAGGINALTGDKLGTVLAQDNYMVAPPQPWLDGWKNKDGSVSQFVATRHEKGAGLTVAEQLIGAESQTGAIGIAVFEPKDRSKLPKVNTPATTSSSGYGGGFKSFAPDETSTSHMDWGINNCFTSSSLVSASLGPMEKSVRSTKLQSAGVRTPVKEMGLGKGGKITQKIHPDPYGLEVWQAKPAAVFAVYLVDAATAAAITGEQVAAPAESTHYNGPWYKQVDGHMGDVPGSGKFDQLKSASQKESALKSGAFPGQK